MTSLVWTLSEVPENAVVKMKLQLAANVIDQARSWGSSDRLAVTDVGCGDLGRLLISLSCCLTHEVAEPIMPAVSRGGAVR